MEGHQGTDTELHRAVFRDLELLVTGRERGPRLMDRIPNLLQVKVPEEPGLIYDTSQAVVAFLMAATERVGVREGEVQAKALRTLLGLAPETAALFKTARCDLVGELYERHGLTPRSGKVVASRVPTMLEDLADEIVRMEGEARDWRDRDRDEPTPDALSIEWPQFEEVARQIAHDIRGENRQIDAVVAIARGGLALGARLAHLLHVRRFGTVTAWKCPSVPTTGEQGPPWTTRFEAIGLPAGDAPRRVLIVDDTLGRGRTLLRAKKLVQAHYSPPPEVVFAALYRIRREAEGDLPDELQEALFGAYPLPDGEPPWVQMPWEQPDPAANGR